MFEHDHVVNLRRQIFWGTGPDGNYTLQYFRPSLSYQLLLRSLFCLFLEWPFYTGFTVPSLLVASPSSASLSGETLLLEASPPSASLSRGTLLLVASPPSASLSGGTLLLVASPPSASLSGGTLLLGASPPSASLSGGTLLLGASPP